MKRKDELRYRGIEFLQASGWQRADQEHPAGKGNLGYRAVYKTLKLIPFPEVNLSWLNLTVRIVVEKVEYGGMSVSGNTIPSLYPNRLLLPEYIEIKKDGNSITYQGDINMKWEFNSYSEEFPSSGIVELILEVDNPNEDDVISKGRRSLSPILCILDLSYGERLIGALIAEEVVEIFPDRHWNRKITSPLVGSESQLDMRKIEDHQIEEMKKSIDKYQGFEIADKKSTSLATEWFWKSERESNKIDKFIQLWICLEALEMKTTNIKPIYELLGKITPEDTSFWKDPVGRLFGKRGALVHGNINDIDDYEIIILREIAKLLLANRFGCIETSELVRELISLVKSHYK